MSFLIIFVVNLVVKTMQHGANSKKNNNIVIFLITKTINKTVN